MEVKTKSPCRECYYASFYNEDFCICWHPLIKGSKIQATNFCIVKALQKEQEELRKGKRKNLLRK